MRVLIFYFSGTFNTEKIALLFKREFNAGIREIRMPFPKTEDIKDYDVIAFGYPIHAFNPPEPFFRFIKSLPKQNKKLCFLFKTSGEDLKLNFCSSRMTVNALRKKGFDVIEEFHYVMPYNIIYRHKDGVAKLMYETAIKRVRDDADKIRNNKRRTLSFGLRGLYVPLFRIEWPFSRIHGRLFYKVDEDKCIHCMECVKNCPMENICLEDNKIKFRNQCCLCMRCSLYCKANAIKIGFFDRRWKVNGSYELDRLLGDENIKTECEDFGSKLLTKSYDNYFNDEK